MYPVAKSFVVGRKYLHFWHESQSSYERSFGKENMVPHPDHPGKFFLVMKCYLATDTEGSFYLGPKFTSNINTFALANKEVYEYVSAEIFIQQGNDLIQQGNKLLAKGNLYKKYDSDHEKALDGEVTAILDDVKLTNVEKKSKIAELLIALDMVTQ